MVGTSRAGTGQIVLLVMVASVRGLCLVGMSSGPRFHKYISTGQPQHANAYEA